MRRVVFALGLALAGCNDPATATPDAAPTIEPDAPAMQLDAPSGGDGLVDYEKRIISQLTGAAEISPGLTLVHRASVAERNAVRTYLIAEFAALGITAEAVAYTSGATSGANIIATLPGSEAGPIIVVGGHFDGVPAGPAAADNATGTAMVLAIARHLVQVPDRKHTIVFAVFDQEELGLLGSRAYVAALKTAGTQLRGAHIYDMVSWDSDHDRAVELWSPTPALEAMYRAKGMAAAMPIQPVAFESSDHQAFLEGGFPAVGICEEYVGGDHTPHYHKASDTAANVQFDYLEAVTRLAFSVLEADVTAP